MREIIQVQVGQCGNQVGYKFWETISKEHGIQSDGSLIHGDDKGDLVNQLQMIDVFYSETRDGRYIPRSILADLEPGALDTIKSNPYGSLFKPDNFILGNSGTGNNFGKGHYTEGIDLIEPILDSIRKEIEQCDNLQGFQLTHSIGGGTGSGLGTLILMKLRDEYPDRMICTYTIYPSSCNGSIVVMPYNAILSHPHLIENSDQVFCIDNEALHNIFHGVQHYNNYNEINHLISTVMSGITSSLRFPGQLNSDLRKLSVNLVPFPRLHFFSTSISPIMGVSSTQFTVPQLVQQLFDAKNMMVSCNPDNGKYLTASVIFRGRSISTLQVDEQLSNLSNCNGNQFVEWIPNNIKTTFCNVSPTGLPISATLISNNTCIQDVFKRNLSYFSALFSRKAFLHMYTLNGIEELEFTEAESYLLDLVGEYQLYSDLDLLYEDNDNEKYENETCYVY